MLPSFDDYKQHKAARRLLYNIHDGNSFRATCITDRIAIMRYTLNADEEDSLVRLNKQPCLQIRGQASCTARLRPGTKKSWMH